MSEHDPSPRKFRRGLALTVRLMMLLIVIIAAGLGLRVHHRTLPQIGRSFVHK
jgi:hypothetical protein